MAIVTYLDTSCLIAEADTEPMRAGRVTALLNDPSRLFMYSPFTTLETLSLAIHYRKPLKAQFFRRYINICVYHSNNLAEIVSEAHRQAE